MSIDTTKPILHLTQLDTALLEPLHMLERHFVLHKDKIQQWFAKEWQKTVPPVYGSVDLRNAGFKLAPIDMNLFPAGFNNLNRHYFDYAVNAAKKIIYQIAPDTKKILVIPEGHTRNLFYWENVRTLQMILENAGFVVRLGSLDEALPTSQEIELPSSAKVTVEKLLRVHDQLQLTDYVPDFILLNNDLSEGIPAILQNLRQHLIPPVKLGWSQRLKSEHFQYYAQVVDEFAKLISIDPWLIAPLFKHCGHVDFLQQEGIDCLVEHANDLFAQIRKKYAEYNIPYQPFLIVKADAGTYGMAVMTVRNVDELKSMNRKQRTRMSATKGKQPVHRVIIQEGVYSFEIWGENKSVAEPVVYLWGSCVVGGFYRVHKDRANDENLNAPGMHFEPIAFPKSCHEPCEKVDPDACQNRLFAYGIVASLSMLAAAREMKDQMPR